MDEAKKIDFIPDEGQSIEVDPLKRLSNVNLELSVELGSVVMSVNDLLSLDRGTIIDLNKSANEPLKVFANGTLVAKGEITVDNNNFAIRIVEIVSNEG